ncbi:hypothetical protein NCAS_0F00210 [Naumovozyma castellii]|uniref:Uncharacterized protein n=1 Tax=Naumovozyma castellii TaxID=27288 RepID=G0VG85_NAUCA|nr:hypothetical protein NCAS_0F00210 [Naumovozyma castellii CBS 4309]CCC70505.1 hypothetical protein NCAS_0F00210 [Naumovozyma castellii CBS 4309]
MAPPVVVFGKDDIRVKTALSNNRTGETDAETGDGCRQFQLTQFQCQLLEDGQYICFPFKRVFQECQGVRTEVTNVDSNM